MKRKSVIFLAIVISTVVVCDLCFRFFVEGLIETSGFRFARLYSKNHIDAEILVVGNSRAVNSFYVPEIKKLTHKKVFNMGYNGMGPRLVEAVLFDYLDKNKKPELVIIEVSNIWQDIGPIRDLRMYTRYSSRLRELDAMNNSFNSRVALYSQIFACNGESLFRLANYIKRSDQDWVNSGSLNLAEVPKAIDRASKEVKEVAKLDNIKIYARIFEGLKTRNIRYCSVIGPYLIDDSAHLRLLSAIDSCVKGKVIDHSMVIRDPECFADPLHLNRKGALEYAKLFCDELVNAYDGDLYN